MYTLQMIRVQELILNYPLCCNMRCTTCQGHLTFADTWIVTDILLKCDFCGQVCKWIYVFLDPQFVVSRMRSQQRNHIQYQSLDDSAAIKLETQTDTVVKPITILRAVYKNHINLLPIRIFCHCYTKHFSVNSLLMTLNVEGRLAKNYKCNLV